MNKNGRVELDRSKLIFSQTSDVLIFLINNIIFLYLCFLYIFKYINKKNIQKLYYLYQI